VYLWVLIAIHPGYDVQVLTIAGSLHDVNLSGWKLDGTDDDDQPTAYSREIEGLAFLLQRIEFGKPPLMVFRCFKRG
jgi:hypothetical protein